MVTKRSLSPPKPKKLREHPDALEEDLNPTQPTVRTRSSRPSRTRPALEVEELVRALPQLSSDELRQITVARPGSRLRPGGTYLDLRAIKNGSFPAPLEAYAGQDAWYVAKEDVSAQLWERLVDGAGSTRKSDGDGAQGEGAATDGQSRHVLPQGEPRPRAARERSERRSAGAVSDVQATARHARARGH